MAHWPPNIRGGRNVCGRRCKPPPLPEKAGNKAPTAEELGISEEAIVAEVRRREGLPPLPEIPLAEWPLHLKRTTMLDVEGVRALPTLHPETRIFLEAGLKYLGAAPYSGMRTSRTVKPTHLSEAALAQCVAHGKFEKVAMKEPLAQGVHGVNVFTRPEVKRRLRIITEPHLNATVEKASLPQLQYPSRLQRRQQLAGCTYVLQIDFDAYYDSIPLAEASRNLFVFRKGRQFYRLCTVPTGGRWSVAAAQGVTWTLTDFATTATIITMIDNIAVGAKRGEEKEFLRTVRELLSRVQKAHLTTTPPVEELLRATDNDLLSLALRPNVFLGEHYGEYSAMAASRLVSNSTKTVVKLELALRIPEGRHTCRTFVSLVSLTLFAMHTVASAPAEAFDLLRSYRGVCTWVWKNGGNWDAPIPYVAPAATQALKKIGQSLIANTPVPPLPTKPCTYSEKEYTDVIWVDASVCGWSALHSHRGGPNKVLQQRWVHQLQGTGDIIGRQEDGDAFTARHSAHAEPTGALRCLQHLEATGALGRKVAMVTDHEAIVHAQRKENGFGGIGRGRALNELFRWINEKGLEVTFFYIPGPLNPADHTSRNFAPGSDYGVNSLGYTDIAVPLLKETYCPLCERAARPTWMK